MNYHNITTDDMLNGIGLRVVLWLSGCNHYCKGCHNQQTLDKDSGIPFTDETFEEVKNELNKSHIRGLTISGGDSLYPSNREQVTKICEEVKRLYPNKDIWLYTGYDYEDIKDLEVINYIDVIVDGKFIEELADNKYMFAGSTNQRIIDVKATKQNNTITTLT